MKIEKLSRVHRLMATLCLALSVMSGRASNADTRAIAYQVSNFGPGTNPVPSTYDYGRIFKCVAQDDSASWCGNFELEDDPGHFISITESEDWGFSSSKLKQDSNVNWRDFSDQSRQAYFQDTSDIGGDHLTEMGADWGDIVFVATHGYPTFDRVMDYSRTYPNCGTGKGATMMRMGMENSSNPLNVYTTEMTLGGGYTTSADNNKRTRALISGACNSANLCVWKRGGYNEMSGDSFRIYNGYHGAHGSPDASFDDFESYLEGATYDGIGSRWLSEMNTPYATTDAENCPVSVVFCNDLDDCDEMFEDGGAKNLIASTNNNLSKIYWIGGCDPDGSATTYAPLP